MDKWDDSRINEKKEVLAYSLTELVHGKREAEKAKTTAHALFTGIGDDSSMPTTEVAPQDIPETGMVVSDILIRCNLVSSKNEARRLVAQGGITIDGIKITDANVVIETEKIAKGIIIKKGKKIYHRFLIA